MNPRILDAVFEYQQLLSRHLRSGLELKESDRKRMLELRLLLRKPGPRKARQPSSTKINTPKSVLFSVPGGFAEGKMHDVAAVGIVVSAKEKAPIRSRTLLHVHDTASCKDYIFPARIIWRTDRIPGGNIYGMAFDGLPSRTPERRNKPLLRSTITFGPRPEAPLIA